MQIQDTDYNILEMYKNSFPSSYELYKKALNLFPSGVTHDSRFLKPFPIYIGHALGSKKWDEDGNEFIDYWSGHGALLLGHGHPSLIEAVRKQICKGTHYGASHRLEIEWGELVINMIPSAERVRFVNSGTEATLMALRLARTFTGKRKILKFAGHFHGWHDYLIPGVNPPYEAPVPGILKEVAQSVIICPPNDINIVETILKEDNEVACVILEPTGASFGAIPTPGSFLKKLREVTRKYGVLLMFDEVVTGFRCAPGGAQEYYHIMPDATTLGKILVGGLPGGAVVGRKEILELLEIKDDLDWKIYKKMPHLGTFNANPLSASAGITTLKIVAANEPIEKANDIASMLIQGMNQVIDRYGLNWCVYGEFSGFRILPDHQCKKRKNCDFRTCDYDYQKLKEHDPVLTQNLRCGLLLNGIDLHPMGGITSAAHTSDDVTRTIDAFDKTIILMKKNGLI